MIPTILNQDEHEGIIRGYLKKLGCLVELETELINLKQDDEGVDAMIRCPRSEDGTRSEETARFSYVVGADGARGATIILFQSRTH